MVHLLEDQLNLEPNTLIGSLLSLYTPNLLKILHDGRNLEEEGEPLSSEFFKDKLGGKCQLLGPAIVISLLLIATGNILAVCLHLLLFLLLCLLFSKGIPVKLLLLLIRRTSRTSSAVPWPTCHNSIFPGQHGSIYPSIHPTS